MKSRAPKAGHPWRRMAINPDPVKRAQLQREAAERERTRAATAKEKLDRLLREVKEGEALDPIEHDPLADAALVSQIIASAAPRRLADGE